MPLPRRRFLGGLGAVGGTALVLSGPAAAAQSGQRPAAGGRWRDFTVTQSLRGEPVTIVSRAHHAGAVSGIIAADALWSVGTLEEVRNDLIVGYRKLLPSYTAQRHLT